ncbi:hypothetical protein Pla52o_10130 [Novipirellula galeiformis]|uniref:DUF1598 domain-containing protein n=1 Tax=Novipirellula galeiformis TaxID=2528004 RepID=A0A5C6CX02_9BACT|nr:DUF1598 domain-containing protein [Novipirellula galeiformis]TWU27149.1 hypothetical protein Pla52o_10130 [Novipirellula galeiformis]
MKKTNRIAALLVFALLFSFGSDQVSAQNQLAGVDVDANGILKVKQFDPRLAQQRLAEARNRAETGVMQTSKLRKVSLNRLEAEIAKQLEAGGTVSDDMKALAGLTSLEYVFFYPDTKDIVIAGPAEGFVPDPTERLVGIQTGKPTVLLEDVVTALRAYAPGAKPTSTISVSIDPTSEGLQRMQRFLASVRGRVQPSDAERLAMGLKDNLGLQTVTIKGIPNSTHFARVLVEADYRMKLVGIGLERLPVRLQSYVDRANPNTVASNAMERWYFQPNYDAISVSEDGLAMRINERGVELVGANERVANGRRMQIAGKVNRASQTFCKDFTAAFPEIAQKVRVYAELSQLIDIAVAAAYIQEQDFYGQADWSMPVLQDETLVSVETYTAPEQVETAVNAVWRGNTLMTPLGGGVNMQPRQALKAEHVRQDTDGRVVKTHSEAGPSQLKEGQWWWD